MSTKAKKGIVITNARMIDGNGQDPVENTVIFIQGERIESITTKDALNGRPLDDYYEIDVKGKTVLPGLIEGHYHISYTDVLELSDLDREIRARDHRLHADGEHRQHSVRHRANVLTCA